MLFVLNVVINFVGVSSLDYEQGAAGMLSSDYTQSYFVNNLANLLQNKLKDNDT